MNFRTISEQQEPRLIKEVGVLRVAILTNQKIK